MSRQRAAIFKTTAAAGAAVTFGQLTRHTEFASEPAHASPSWVDKPMRWAQLTLVEDDPGKFDPQFWLDYFTRTKSDAVCLSAGGCVAYYPTTIPLHHRSAWLGSGDAFGDLVAGCRKLGMVVIARTDPRHGDDVQRPSRLGSRHHRRPSAPALGVAEMGRAASDPTTSSSWPR